MEQNPPAGRAGKTGTSAEASAKAGRYFKYAIGEIILVVIGILIALQINNWNEIKKDRAFEVKMLTEVKKALIKDKAHFQTMIKRNAVADSTADLFIDLIDQNVVFSDTMYSVLSGLRRGTLYQYNRGPYEAIKSSGMSIKYLTIVYEVTLLIFMISNFRDTKNSPSGMIDIMNNM